jgi:hypothetical protein
LLFLIISLNQPQNRAFKDINESRMQRESLRGAVPLSLKSAAKYIQVEFIFISGLLTQAVVFVAFILVASGWYWVWGYEKYVGPPTMDDEFRSSWWPNILLVPPNPVPPRSN